MKLANMACPMWIGLNVPPKMPIVIVLCIPKWLMSFGQPLRQDCRLRLICHIGVRMKVRIQLCWHAGWLSRWYRFLCQSDAREELRQMAAGWKQTMRRDTDVWHWVLLYVNVENDIVTAVHDSCKFTFKCSVKTTGINFFEFNECIGGDSRLESFVAEEMVVNTINFTCTWRTIGGRNRKLQTQFSIFGQFVDDCRFSRAGGSGYNDYFAFFILISVTLHLEPVL